MKFQQHVPSYNLFEGNLSNHLPKENITIFLISIRIFAKFWVHVRLMGLYGRVKRLLSSSEEGEGVQRKGLFGLGAGVMLGVKTWAEDHKFTP